MPRREKDTDAATDKAGSHPPKGKDSMAATDKPQKRLQSSSLQNQT